MATTLTLEPPSTTVLDDNSAHTEAKSSTKLTSVLNDNSAHTEAKSSPKPNSTVYRLHQGLKKALPKNPLRKLKQTSASSEGAEGKPTSSPTKTQDVKEEDEIIQIQSPGSLNSKKSTDPSCLPLKNINVFKRKQASPKGQGLEEKLPSSEEEAIQTKSAAPSASTKTTIHGFLSLLLKRKQASPSIEPEGKLPSTSEKEEQKPLPSEEEEEDQKPLSSQEERSSSEEEQEQQQPPSSSEQEKQKPSLTTEEQEQGQHKPPSSEEDPTNSTKTKNRSWLNILKGKQASSSKGLEEKLPPSSKEEKLPATSEEDVIQTQPPKPSKSTKRTIPGCFSGKNRRQALSSINLEEKQPSSSASETAPTVNDKQKEPQNLPSSSSTKEEQDQQKPPSSSEEEQQKLPSSTTEEQKPPPLLQKNKTNEPSNSTKPPSGDDKHLALQ